MILIQAQYEIGETVFLKTDTDQLSRMVIGYNVRPGTVLYLLQHGTRDSLHYEMEISRDRDTLQAIGVNMETNS